MKKTIFIISILFILVSSACAYEINWQEPHGPFGGNLTTTVYGDPLDDRIIATFDATSFDGGNNFILNRLTLYSGTNSRGVARSTDGGTTWAMMDPQDGGISALTVYNLAFNPFDASNIFAGTNGGYWMSTDSGDNWSQLVGGGKAANITFNRNDPNIAYGVVGGRAYKIDFSVPTYEALSLITSEGITFGHTSLGYDPHHEKLYVATAKLISGVTYSRIFSTTNEGASWVREDPGGLQPQKITRIFFPPLTSEVYTKGGNQVRVSVDNSGTFPTSPGYHAVSYGYEEFLYISPYDRNFAFILKNQDNTLYPYRIYKTTDHGANWQLKNSGLPPQTLNGPHFTVRHILANPKGGEAAVFLNSSNGLYASVDGGETFIEINGEETSSQTNKQSFVNTSIKCLAVDRDGDVFAGGIRWSYYYTNEYNGHGMFRSTDNGQTWDRINNGIVSIGINAAAVQSKYLGTELPNDVIYISNQTGIYKSKNKGSLWETSGSIDTNCFEVDQQGNVYAGTSANGVFIGISDPLHPENGAYDWQPMTQTKLLDVNITAMDIDSSGTIYAGTNSGKIYRLNVGTEEWESLGVGLPAGPVNSIEFDPNTNYIWAGNNAAVYNSTDDGASWPLSQSIPGGINDIFIDADSLPSTIYAAAHGRGLWRTTDDGSSWQRISLADEGRKLGTHIYSISVDDATKTFYLGNAVMGVTTGITDIAKPPKPLSFIGTAESSSKINWGWTDVATQEFGYKFYRDDPSGQTLVLPSNTVAYDETGLEPNKFYTRHVSAYTTEESASDPYVECTLANAPTNLRATFLYGDRITLNWNTNGNPPGTYYIMEVTTEVSGPFVPGSYEVVSADPPQDFTGLTPQTMYRFRVFARNHNDITTEVSNILTESTTHETLGPRIYNIRFDDIILVEGDIIRPDPVITAYLTDEATPPEGPKPIVKDSIVLDFSDNYKIYGDDLDSFTSSEGVYIISHKLKTPLGAGEFVFKITAYDTLGNMGESIPKSLRVMSGAVQMVGPTVVYPTPFSPVSKGGEATITYTLSTDAPVNIFMYDIGGKVMWTRRFSPRANGGRTGYNEVKWNGITDFGGYAGNGIYVYKVVAGGRVIGTGKLVVYD